jgi:hypothetical protein
MGRGEFEGVLDAGVGDHVWISRMIFASILGIVVGPVMAPALIGSGVRSEERSEGRCSEEGKAWEGPGELYAEDDDVFNQEQT